MTMTKPTTTAFPASPFWQQEQRSENVEKTAWVEGEAVQDKSGKIEAWAGEWVLKESYTRMSDILEHRSRNKHKGNIEWNLSEQGKKSLVTLVIPQVILPDDLRREQINEEDLVSEKMCFLFWRWLLYRIKVGHNFVTVDQTAKNGEKTRSSVHTVSFSLRICRPKCLDSRYFREEENRDTSTVQRRRRKVQLLWSISKQLVCFGQTLSLCSYCSQCSSSC